MNPLRRFRRGDPSTSWDPTTIHGAQASVEAIVASFAPAEPPLDYERIAWRTPPPQYDYAKASSAQFDFSTYLKPSGVSPSKKESVWWAYTISIDGRSIGNVQSVTHHPAPREILRHPSFKSPFGIAEYVPGTTGLEITLDRVRLFTKNMVETFEGMHEFMNKPFDIVETLHCGEETRTLTYRNCLVTEMGHHITVGTTIAVETMRVCVEAVSPEPPEFIEPHPPQKPLYASLKKVLDKKGEDWQDEPFRRGGHETSPN